MAPSLPTLRTERLPSLRSARGVAFSYAPHVCTLHHAPTFRFAYFSSLISDACVPLSWLALGGFDRGDEAELDEASLVAARHEGHHERATQRREARAGEACAPEKAAASATLARRPQRSPHWAL